MEAHEFDLEKFKKPWIFECKLGPTGNNTDFKIEPELGSFILKNICIRLAKGSDDTAITRREVQKLIVGAWIATYQNSKNVDFSE